MRKLCSFIFSRYFISAVLILAELVIIGFVMYFAYEYSFFIFAFLVAVNIASVISIINRDANPEYKVSWLVVVLVVPFFGMALYVMFYSRRVSRREAELMNKIQNELSDFCDTGCGEDGKWDEVFSELKEMDELAAGKAFAILNDDRLSTVYRESSSKYYPDGECMFSDMLSDISSAEKFIFLEYFIIENGYMWARIHDKLMEKAKAGVEVRVLYDDIGCMKTIPMHYDRKLRAEGIKCLRFSPVSPRITTAHNNRDHRKILITDGLAAYTGGINIADEYINKKMRFGHWKDGGIRVEGEAVLGFIKLFLSMWDTTVGKITEHEKYLSAVKKSDSADGGFYLPFGSGPAPVYNRPVGKNAILNIINQAKNYVYITTPYLIVDYDLTESLCNAAMRGVDVRIITPKIADKKIVKVMTKSAYPYLMRSGIKICEYTPGFIHEKCILSDDLYAIVGTINLDYRSLVHHYENAVWICGSDTVIRIKEEFLKTASISLEIDDNDAKLSLCEWCVRNLVRIFAPLL